MLQCEQLREGAPFVCCDSGLLLQCEDLTVDSLIASWIGKGVYGSRWHVRPPPERGADLFSSISK